jgi:8-oxo-dGTP diphosphatase
MSSIHVAVAAIADSAGRILLAKRPTRAHQGGLWEFPGGKLDPGEDVVAALRRECAEELGIEVLGQRPLIRIQHHYPDRSVLLDVHRVTDYRGEPTGLEGQPLVWVLPGELRDYAMPAADVPIVNAIQLPELYLITPALVSSAASFLRQLRGRLEQGLRLVQFRVRQAPQPLAKLAEEVMRLCVDAGAELLINRDIALARALGAAGVHLTSDQLQTLPGRPEGLRWVAASCHTSADLARLAQLGGDFAVLSPVKPTGSHPEASPLGWARFSEMLGQAKLPVFALGGLGETDLQDAWRAGAQGVAGISALWGGRVDDRQA